MTVAFMRAAVVGSPDTTYAVAAAARYALLYAPEKADIRTTVIAAVSQLVRTSTSLRYHIERPLLHSN